MVPAIQATPDQEAPRDRLAVYFHRALTQFGVQHELVIYPREGHSFTERAHWADALERIRAWFTRWLVGPSES